MNKELLKQLYPNDEEIKAAYQNGIEAVLALFKKQSEIFFQYMTDLTIKIEQLKKDVGDAQNRIQTLEQIAEKLKNDIQ
jgi:hypothetical protein